MGPLERQSYSSRTRLCILAPGLLISFLLLTFMHCRPGQLEAAAKLQARAPAKTRSVITVNAISTFVSVYTPTPSPGPVTTTRYTSDPRTETTTLIQTDTNTEIVSISVTTDTTTVTETEIETEVRTETETQHDTTVETEHVTSTTHDETTKPLEESITAQITATAHDTVTKDAASIESTSDMSPTALDTTFTTKTSPKPSPSTTPTPPPPPPPSPPSPTCPYKTCAPSCPWTTCKDPFPMETIQCQMVDSCWIQNPELNKTKPPIREGYCSCLCESGYCEKQANDLTCGEFKCCKDCQCPFRRSKKNPCE